jgi:hypothetical protein
MRTVPVVVADKLRQHRPQVTLVEHDQVIETFSSQCSDDTFGDRVRTWRSNGRRDGIDADMLGSSSEVATVHSVPITEQMTGLLSPGRRSE